MDSACNVLCLNHGSSSLKFALYDMQRGDELHVAEGAAEGIGLPTGRFSLRGSKGETLIDRSVESATLEAAVAAMSRALGEHGFLRFSAVGHRVLHGGPD